MHFPEDWIRFLRITEVTSIHYGSGWLILKVDHLDYRDFKSLILLRCLISHLGINKNTFRGSYLIAGSKRGNKIKIISVFLALSKCLAGFDEFLRKKTKLNFLTSLTRIDASDFTGNK